MAGTASNELKDILGQMNLPHFTWITEIATIDSYNQASPGMRRMYGHSIIDATSTGRDVLGHLALHLPGLVIQRDVNSEQERVVVISDDALYNCRDKTGA